MQAELFYTSESKGAIPLYFISQKEWEKREQDLSSLEYNSFALRQFKGKLGDYCFIPNGDGLMDAVYIGSGEGAWDSALANAAVLVPQGTYQVKDKIPNEALSLWALAQYRFTAYKKIDLNPKVLCIPKDQSEPCIDLVQAIFTVRDLINTPPNDLGPTQLGEYVEELAKTYHAQCDQWVGDSLIQENFPAIHAVGRASSQAPRLISLRWGNKEDPLITLVGKGVCFDSGGLDIKSASGMRIMKKDMGGAAHVIGLAQWIMGQRLPVHLHVLIPAVENAVGADAYRPGDILTMRNGLTVEIENTDAEGRLILADALVKACEEKPELLIDFATLTGAARIAVGTEIAAMFSNNDTLAEAITKASAQARDPVWRMPLHTPYEDMLNSSAADLTNSNSSSYAGAIVAALFLQKFIEPSIPWAHFDVMAWNLGSKPGKPEGGEATGFRALVRYLQESYGKSSQ